MRFWSIAGGIHLVCMCMEGQARYLSFQYVSMEEKAYACVLDLLIVYVCIGNWGRTFNLSETWVSFFQLLDKYSWDK